MSACGSPVLLPYDAMSAAEVLAATRLWLQRAVIGLNLCPFAKAVFNKKQIRYALTGARTPDELLGELERELSLLAEVDPATIETTLLIHPRALEDFLDFHFFQAEANAVLRNLGLEGTLQIASFHPQFEFAGTAPEDVENNTNRSPHPMLHLLRESSIDRAVAAYPDSAEITDRNIQTLRRLGHDGWQRLFEDDDGQGTQSDS